MLDNYKEYLIQKLKNIRKEDIIISEHAYLRMVQRQVNPEEVVENIINPIRLEYAIRESSPILGEEKFDCYLGYSKTMCHKYILAIRDKVIVVTAVKINRRWQLIAENKLK